MNAAPATMFAVGTGVVVVAVAVAVVLVVFIVALSLRGRQVRAAKRRHEVGEAHERAGRVQFAYQFPEWCERMALVSSGGLGDEVNVMQSWKT